jgi:Tol biopolymer transport system component
VKGVTADGIGAIVWLPTRDELVVGGQRISLDGSPPRPFGHPGRKPTDQSDIPMDPVSVRGARLAFDTPESRFRLMRVPLAGAAKAPLTPFFPSTRGERDPAFAPDGRKVAFTSGRSGDNHIWIGDADGSKCRELPLPPGSKFGGSPSWSPDGRRLAFDADVGGTWHVYIATPEGGTLRRLTSDRTSDARPRWSRDGRFIYFASIRSGGDWQVWKALADAEDADARAVQITRSSAIEAEESFDGRYLYYAKRWVAGVFRLSLDTPGVREERVLDFAGEGRWHLGARGIHALDLESGRPTIRFYDFASGATSMVLELPLAPWDFPRLNRAFTASPDERWALIDTLQVVESDIMLLEGFR